mgnify:FL=1
MTELSWLGMGLIYIILIIPIILNRILGLKISRNLLQTVIHMSLQLILIGYYLEVLFRLNNVWLNIGWLLVMMLIANITTLKRAHLGIARMLPGQFIAIGISFLTVLFYFLLVALRLSPWYDAAYLVTIGGMLLGGIMRGNVVALERFYSALQQRNREFMAMQLLGATPKEACKPFFVESMQAALMPHLANMATVGIVSLPGMMTGQMISGGSPLTAIRYQVAIMVTMFVAMELSSFLSIKFSIRKAFDERGNLKTGL